MKLNRLVGLAISGLCAAAAGIIAMRLVAHDPVQKEDIQNGSSAVEFVNVLVSARDLAIGSPVERHSLEWIAVPRENVFKGFIDDVSRPHAIDELNGTRVRIPMLKGDPIRLEKLVGYAVSGNVSPISSLLSQGKRAAAIDISVSNAVGGMIVPNDYVDVIMVRILEGGRTRVDVVLKNIRIIAIDQSIDAEGKQSMIGGTATLELTQEQVKALMAAQNMAAKLSLVLRSASDIGGSEAEDSDFFLDSQKVQVIRAGSVTTENEEVLK
ncbi:MAG: Flp pilus assembly protein CpaB [Candidatus Liberibacter ctenarytainae]|uniref:Flp pilus assembly protein CpaB n=1 Tax=Candidatus Liberibacter ctenarytainae TaxID=2020335 RepID=A0A937AJ48_9HYPH|nr:Flp pilus assembly protein CpaB [Candidatus Liberibacter ctenarytainae]